MKVSNAVQSQPNTATTSAQQTRLQAQKRVQQDQQAAAPAQQQAPKVKPQQLGNNIDVKA